MLLVGPSAALEADGATTNWFLNGDGHTIQGGGVVTAWILNSGTVSANDHSLHINEFGRLLLVNNTQLNVLQHFSFALRDETLWPMANRTLNMKGSGDWQGVEVGGEDLGLVAAGFTSNFSLGTLHIRANARAFLNNAIDNGNRHSPEVLYADNLIIDPGATLNLNGIRIYTHLSPHGSPELVMIDQDNYSEFSHLFGGSLTHWTLSAVEVPVAGVLLNQNRPNPFNPSTQIELFLPREMPVKMDVYDVAGRHVVDWNGESSQGQQVCSGVYFYVLSIHEDRMVGRMVLVR